LGFFETMIWIFIGVIVLITYGILYIIRVSKGLHFWGKPIAQDKFQTIKIQYAMIFIFLAVITFVVPFKLPEKKEDPNAWKTRDNKASAYTMMQDFVQDYLKSPGSAKFEWISEPDCKIERNETIYDITSWVDSQNSFGALVRTKFNGVIEQLDNKNWALRYLNLDNERTFIDWNWAKSNGYFEILEFDFTYRFKKFIAYYIADSAVNSLDINTDSTQTIIKTSGFGEYTIILNHVSNYIIDNVIFSYKDNGTNYQNNISNKVFISLVGAIEQFYTEDEVIDLIRQIYGIKDSEKTISLSGNIYSKNVNGDNYSYTILLRQ